jgi:hypothetical protein
MRTRPLHHRLRRAIPVLSLAALLAMCTSGASIAAVATVPKTKTKPKNHVLLGPLTGTWSGTYSGAFSGKFTLHWTQVGSSLKGKITLSKPSGTYPIGGSVRRKSIRFGAVGAGATYNGTVSGSSMSGHYTSPGGGGAWSASKN